MVKHDATKTSKMMGTASVGVKSICSTAIRAHKGKPRGKIGGLRQSKLISTSSVVKAVKVSTQEVADDSVWENIERETMGESWYKVLEPEFKKPYFRKLKEFLVSENKSHTIYPPARDIYSWSRLTPLDSVKVVVIGQDPYHDVGQAHGLAFSVLPPTKTPASLRNIYKQVAAEIPAFVIPKSGDLSRLAQQGVLWLNTSLTVRAHMANSHKDMGWQTFTAEVLRAVTARKEARGIVFFAWGAHAQKTCASINIDETKHLVLKSAHPSPLSASRGFFGNGHFKKANEWLRERYGEAGEVNWAVLND